MEVSASILIQYQNAAWKPQKPPNASSTHRKKPPSSGTALESSVATRACDRPQKSRHATSMRAAAPGPPSRTITSRPNGPEDTKMKIVPARDTTPRPRRRRSWGRLCMEKTGALAGPCDCLCFRPGCGPAPLRTADRGDLDRVRDATTQRRPCARHRVAVPYQEVVRGVGRRSQG